MLIWYYAFRLSQVAGAKLVAGNSSIADLGDKYRPTRIAELYLELYDNEWTEAVDTLLNGNRWPEDMIIRHLFIILQVNLDFFYPKKMYRPVKR